MMTPTPIPPREAVKIIIEGYSPDYAPWSGCYLHKVTFDRKPGSLGVIGNTRGGRR